MRVIRGLVIGLVFLFGGVIFGRVPSIEEPEAFQGLTQEQIKEVMAGKVGDIA